MRIIAATILVCLSACATLPPPTPEEKAAVAVQAVATDTALIVVGQATMLTGAAAALNAADGEKNMWWVVAGFGSCLSLAGLFFLPGQVDRLEAAFEEMTPELVAAVPTVVAVPSVAEKDK